MYHSARDLFGSRVNFGSLVEHVVAGRRLVRAVAYVIRTPGGEEKAFFDALTHAGIETREKDIQVFFGGAKKADWDVGLAVDAIRIAPLLDVVIIVSGDGDFIPLVEYLRYHGRQIEVAAFRNTTSSKLVEAADSFIDLAELKDDILITPPRGGGKRVQRSGAPLRGSGRKPAGREPISDF
jgi:uncharacterized LabA/DUF88 family protein